jgi:hypothetical protein
MASIIMSKLGRLQNLIGIDVDGDLHIVRKCKLLQDRSDGVTRLAYRFCPDENLEPVVSLCTLDRSGNNRIKGRARAQLLGLAKMDGLGAKLAAALML